MDEQMGEVIDPWDVYETLWWFFFMSAPKLNLDKHLQTAASNDTIQINYAIKNHCPDKPFALIC